MLMYNKCLIIMVINQFEYVQYVYNISGYTI